MSNTKLMNKECISNRGAVRFYKFLLYPSMMIFLFLIAFFGLQDAKELNEYVLIVGIISPALGIIIIFFLKTEIVFIDADGIYFSDKMVIWKDVIKIQFLYICPPFVNFLFKDGAKKKQIFSVLPFSRYRKIKGRIFDYKKS